MCAEFHAWALGLGPDDKKATLGYIPLDSCSIIPADGLKSDG